MLLQIILVASNLLPAFAIRSDYNAASYSNSEPRDIAAAVPQQIAVAPYIYPTNDPDAWKRLIAYPKEKLSVLIANVFNRPGTTVDSNYEAVIADTFAAGKLMLGYVRTGYFALNDAKTPTRLGSIELSDWLSQIEIDVDLWYTLYPGKIGGIFFDEAWNDCGTNNIYSELYRLVSENTKRKHPGAFTVLNPGAPMPQCFEHSADTLMTFENSFEAYTKSYQDNGWNAQSGRKIWHIVYNVPQDKVSEISNLASQRGAGLIEITNDVYADPAKDNPYDNLPDDSYMQTLLKAVSGDNPGISEPLPFPDGPAASTPSGLKVDSAGSSYIKLGWSPVTNSIGYKVYLNGASILTLTKFMTHVTVGNLQPGTSGLSFEVTAVGGKGNESARSNAISASTTT